jgi:hypothetical protein
MTRPLYPPEEEPLVPLDRRLGGSHSRSRRRDEEKNSQPLPGLEPLIFQPVAQSYTTDLSWLLICAICCLLKTQANYLAHYSSHGLPGYETVVG